jgi:hypothetical protein
LTGKPIIALRVASLMRSEVMLAIDLNDETALEAAGLAAEVKSLLSP